MVVSKIRGKLSELFCAVLCMTVVHNDTHTHQLFLNLSVGLDLGLVFVHLLRFSILCFFSGLAYCLQCFDTLGGRKGIWPVKIWGMVEVGTS